jgi:hypothetical protein
MHFVTVELPKVSKAVIVGLETGYFDRTSLTSFRFKNSTIHFLGQLVNQVFNCYDGSLLPPSDIQGAAVGTIRKICEYFYKLALPYSEEKVRVAKENFLRNEEDLKRIGGNPEVLAFANELRKDFERYWSSIAAPHAHEILKEFRPRRTNGTFVGCDDLYFLSRVSTRASGVYPSDCESYKGFYKPYEGIGRYEQKKVVESDYSELLLVPKDSRGPRTICREHLKRVETQMSYFDYMTDRLTAITEGAINFKDQLVNRKIAEESSVSKMYSTLDLKDASDRVSIKIIKKIFENAPGLRWFFHGSRRATNVLIDDEFHPLNKVAGMGSGLTFPTMSLLISLAICHEVQRSYPHLKYEEIRKRVFVYGDDICVPTHWVKAACRSLAKVGLEVNMSKSFAKGFFRESCGADFYFGVDVTPCRIKLANSKVGNQHSGTITIADNAMAFKQLYEHSKELWKHGFQRACKVVMRTLSKFHNSTFGTPMTPGKFDEDCDLPVDYTKGTRHLRVGVEISLYTIQPVRTGGLDDRNIITRNGHVLRRCPYTYLGSTLRASSRTQSEFVKASCELNYARTKPSAASTFAEITNPRALTFVKKSILSDFLIEEYSQSREWHYANYVRSAVWEAFGQLIVCSTFYSAYL